MAQQTFLRLNWMKCQGNVWCGLTTLRLDKVTEHGVYVIWHDGDSGRYVYVGQGDVSDRLGKHRADTTITEYSTFGTLYATWASVSELYMDGVERYLADQLQPLVGPNHPDVTPIVVNLPQ